MRSEAELNPYQMAYLCGGSDRVAIVVLVALHEYGRIRISPDRHRVYVVQDSPRDEVETAALEVIPKVGRVLGLTMLMVAATPAVEQVGQELREKRLIPNSRLSALWQWGRVKTARDLRRRLSRTPGELARIAALGECAIANDTLREIFETHVYEPPVSIPLTNPRLDPGFDPLHSTGTPDRSHDAGSQMGLY